MDFYSVVSVIGKVYIIDPESGDKTLLCVGDKIASNAILLSKSTANIIVADASNTPVSLTIQGEIPLQQAVNIFIESTYQQELSESSLNDVSQNTASNNHVKDDTSKKSTTESDDDRPRDEQEGHHHHVEASIDRTALEVSVNAEHQMADSSHKVGETSIPDVLTLLNDQLTTTSQASYTANLTTSSAKPLAHVDLPINIEGVFNGVTAEDNILTATGFLSLTGGVGKFPLQTYHGQYGSLSLDSSGHWTYTLDNKANNVDALTDGQQVAEHFDIHAVNGSGVDFQHPLIINITGTNDRAIITGSDTGSVTEESLLQATGKLEVQDIDAGEAFFKDGDLQGQHGTLHLQKDGSWTYDLNNNDPDVQALGAGKQTSDTITVTTIEGTTRQITIAIHGTNDAAVVIDKGAHGVQEDTNLHGHDLVATGQLGLKDIDSHESFFQREAVTGIYGTFAINTDGHWQYKTDDTLMAIQSLAPGQHVQDVATVLSADGTQHDLVITITGSADHPVIHVTPADVTGSVIEDKYPAATGHLTAFAVDETTSLTWSLDHSAGKYGSIMIDPVTGQWTYALGQGTANQAALSQQLQAGEKHTEVFRATVTDSHGTTSEQDIAVRVVGTNDRPLVGGDQSGNVTEESGLSVSGVLTISDIDHGEDYFRVGDVIGKYGTLHIKQDGSWTYDLDNSNPDVQALGDSSQIQEHINVKAADGTLAPLTIDIHGTNDVAVIGGVHQGQVTEESALQASGTLTIKDIDTGEDHFIAQDLQGVHGVLHLKENGTWTYDLNNTDSAVQAMGASTSTIETLVVQAADGTPHKINITINGTNDSAIITGSDTGSVTEESLLQATGKLEVQDIDAGEAFFKAGDLQGQHGTLHLQKDGLWTYDLNNNDPDVQALGAGKQTSDTITVTTIEGTTRQITIAIHGTNDAAMVTDKGIHGVQEDTNLQGHDLIATGQLGIKDVDSHESYFQRESVAGIYGSFAINTDGHWQYKTDDTLTAIQGLAPGQHVQDVATVLSADGTQHDLVVTITGSADHPIIHVTPADVTGSVIEDKSPSATGQLTADAVDQTASLTWTLDHSAGKYGSIMIDPVTGKWTYALGQGTANQAALSQELQAGEKHTEVFRATVTDSHGTTSEQDIAVRIVGTNDTAIVGGDQSGNVTEESGLSVSGVLTISDIDHGEDYFRVGDVIGKYGTLHIKQDGSWTYDLDNSNPDVQALGDSSQIQEHINVKAADGTLAPLTIDIHGTNDVAVIGGVHQGQVTEESALQASGTLTIKDTDTGEDHFQDGDIVGQYGNLHINSNGQWTYTLDNGNKDVQALGASEQKTDTLQVLSADGTTQTISVVVQGTNDASTIAASMTSNTVTEDNTSGSSVSQVLQSGWKNLDTQDIDADSDAKVVKIEINGVEHVVPANFAMNIAGSHGEFTFTHGTDGHDKWRYTADNTHSEIQELKDGQSLTDTFTLITADGSRLPITATIQGADDHVIIDTPDSTTAPLGTAIEDSHTSVSGTLQAHDVDKDDSVSFMPQTTTNAYGTFSVAADGAWHYNLDSAKTDALTRSHRFAVGFDVEAVSSDGSHVTRHVEVIIQGSDDHAIITESSKEQIIEDGSNSAIYSGAVEQLASGKLDIVDADQGEQGFRYSQFGETAIHDPFHGNLRISDAGSWGYSVPNSALQALAEGQVEQVQYSVTSKGGDTYLLNIEVVGTNDQPTVSVTTITGANEDTHFQMQASHFGYHDVDTNDALGNIKFTDLPDAIEGRFMLNGQPVAAGQNIAAADIVHLEFWPAQDFNGDVSFKYTVSDNSGAATAESAEASGTLNIAPVSDASVIAGDSHGSLHEGDVGDVSHASGTLTITDADKGDTPTFPDVTSVATTYGHIAMINGKWTYTVDQSKVQDLDPNSADDSKHQVSDHYTFTASDGSTQVVSITIVGTNDAPVIESAHAAPGGATSATLKIHDMEIIDHPTGASIDVTAAWGKETSNVPAGAKLVGLYRPGSDHNYIDLAHPGTMSTGHSGAGGFARVDSHGWFGANGIPDTVNTGSGGAGGHGNAWQSGVAVFELPDGHQEIAVINRLCTGGGAEVDYLYFHTYQNLHDGAITLSGEAAANEHITIKEGAIVVASVTSDSSGHWQVAATALTDGKHNLHIENAAGEQSPERVYSISGHTVNDVTPAGLNAEMKEDTAQTTIGGELKAQDADAGDNPHFVAQNNIATQYGHFTILANGQYHYTIDNSNPAVNKLGVHQTLQEHITVTAKTADGEMATHDVTIAINGSVDAPELSTSAAIAQQGSAINLDLHASLIDTGGDAETLTINISGLPDSAVLNHGTHDVTAKMWVLTKADLVGLTLDMQDPNFHGALHLRITATAEASGESESISRGVWLFVNEPPTVASAIIDSTNEDTTHHSIDLLQGASDADTGAAHSALSVAGVSYSVNGAAAVSTLPAGFSLAADGHTLQMDQTNAHLQSLAQGEHETIAVHYTISDPDGGSVQQTASITVNGQNDNPTLGSIATINRNEDGSLVHGQLAFSDKDSSDKHTFTVVDAHGAPLTVHGLTIHADGSYDFNPGDIAYQKLDQGEHLSINAKIVITDSSGAHAEQPIHINLIGQQDVPVVGVIRIPDQTEDRLSELTESQIIEMLKITDADLESLHIEGFSIDPKAGRIEQLGLVHGEPNYRFTPAHNYNGTGIPFSVDVTDGRDHVSAQGTFNILAVNDLQRVGNVDLGSMQEDHSIQISEASLLAHTGDVDTAKSLLQVQNLHVDPAVGTITGDRENGWTFTPGADWNSAKDGGKAPFTFEVVDTSDSSNVAHGHASIEVSAVQDRAVIVEAGAGALTHEITENAATNQIQGILSVTDVDGVAEAVLQTATQIICQYGTVNIVKNSDGTYTWTYQVNNNSADVLELNINEQVNDYFTVHSADGTSHVIDIKVNGSNDLPTVTSVGQYALKEGESALTGQFTVHDNDKGDTATYTLMGHAAAGLTLKPDGSYSFDPSHAAYNSLKVGEVLEVVARVGVTDSHGGVSITELKFEVAGTNDTPTIGAVDFGEVIETQPHPLHFTAADLLKGSSDPDGDKLIITEVHLSNSSVGKLIEDGKGGYTFEPSHTLTMGDLVHLQIGFTVAESGSTTTYQGTASLDVKGVNESPIIDTLHGDNGNYNFGTFEAGQHYSLAPDTSTLLRYISDPESDKLSVAAVRLVDGHGHPLADQSAIVANGDGTFTFSPTAAMASAHQAIHFQYDISDGVNLITASAHGEVDPVQHFHTHEASTAVEDTVLDAAGSITASRSDGTALQFQAATLSGSKLGGTLTLHADGTYSYHLTPLQMQSQAIQSLSRGHWGYDSFTATDSDGHTHNFNVRIAGADDVGRLEFNIGADQDVSAKESQVVSASGSLKIVDVDSDSGSDHFEATNFVAGQYGYMQLDEAGNYTYFLNGDAGGVKALNPSEQLVDHITVTTAEGITQQVAITIHGADDAPVIAAIMPVQTNKDSSSIHGQISATDVDHGDTLTYALAPGESAPPGFVLHSDGSYTFDPGNTAYNGIIVGDRQLVSISVQVTDSTGLTDKQNLMITVKGGNSGPTADAHINIGSTNEDTPITFNERDLLLLSHAADADHDILHVTEISCDPKYGMFSDDGLGHFTFTPAKNVFAQNAEIHFKVSDGQVSTVVTGVGDIHAINDAAVVNAFTLGSTHEDTSKHFSAHDLLSHATDVEGDALSLSGLPTVDARYGVISGDVTTGFTFTPAANFFGKNVPIHFAITDGTDVTQATTHVDVAAVGDSATFTELTSEYVQEDVKFIASGSIEVHDTDGVAQEHFQASNNISGTYGYLIIGQTGHWSYHLNQNHAAGVQGLAAGEKYVEHFTLHSQDGTTHTLSVEILGSQDTASISGQAYGSINEDMAQVAGSLQVHDVDKSEQHFVEQHAVAGNFGHLELTEAGLWTYTLDNSLAKTQALGAGDTRTETFTVTTADGAASKDIVVTLHGQNDAPTITSAAVLPAGIEDTGVAITAAQLLSNASDVDTGETLSVTNISADHGSLSMTGSGAWHFTPEANYNGPVTFSYKVVDSQNAEAPATATMRLSAVNDAPVLTVTAAATSEDIAGGLIVTSADLLAGAHDVDNDSLSIKNVTVQAAQGTISDNGNGTWTFHPAANFHGDATLSYVVNDGTANVSNHMTVAVSSVIDTATVVVAAVSGEEDTAIALNIATTEHGDALQSVTLSGFAAGGQFSAGHANSAGGWVVDAADVAALTYTPPANFNGAMTMNVVATAGDGSQTVDSAAQSLSITVSNTVDQAAVATTAAVSGNEDSAIALNLNVDSHGDTLEHLTLTGFPAGSTFSAGSSDGAGGWVVNGPDVAGLTIQPPLNHEANFDLHVVATTSDGKSTADSAAQTIPVTVHAVDDIATISGDTAAVFTEGAAQATHADLTVAKGAWMATIGAGHNFVPVVPNDPNAGRWYAIGGSEGDAGGVAQGMKLTSGFWVMNMGDPNYGYNGYMTFTRNTDSATAPFTAASPDAAGDLHIHDVDSASATFVAVTDQLGDNGYGTFSMKDGHWSFVANDKAIALPDGVDAKETITFSATDGATHTVTVTLHGTDTPSEFKGDVSGTIAEGDTGDVVSAQGTLTISDADSTQTPVIADFHDVAGANGYGSFTMVGGQWTYTVDQSKVQSLSVGVSEQDKITVTASDGSTQDIVVLIQGSNDAPTVTPLSLSGSEDRDYTFSASNFGFTDIDTSDKLEHVTITSLPSGAEGELQLNGVVVTANQQIDNADIASLVFKPAAHFSGDVHFSYTVNDGHEDSAPAQATLDIASTSVSPAPPPPSAGFSIEADEPQLNLGQLHETIQNNANLDSQTMFGHLTNNHNTPEQGTAHDRGVSILMSAEENEATQHLQNLIDQKLIEHHDNIEAADQSLPASPELPENGEHNNADAQNVAPVEHATSSIIDTHHGSSTGHGSASLDSLVPKPGDDSLPPI